MIDTGRNYLTPTVIKMAIDTMAYTKLNLLHWHIVDDECASPLPHIPHPPPLAALVRMAPIRMESATARAAPAAPSAAATGC